MDKTSLGDRMKSYEFRETRRTAMPRLPLVARLDGKGFSRFTQGLARPFDERLSQLMVDTTIYLVEQTQAVVGYTQSDEISLVFESTSDKHQIFLAGKLQKMTSILASMATAYFNRELAGRIPEKAGELPLFDCRAWSVPSREEAVNSLLWRQRDASKNSISMAARAHFSHSEVEGKNGKEKQDMLHSVGVNWNDFPTFFKRGSFVRSVETSRQFTSDELDALPEKHAARSNPDLVVTRSSVVAVDLPPLSQIANPVAAVFEQAEPQPIV